MRSIVSFEHNFLELSEKRNTHLKTERNIFFVPLYMANLEAALAQCAKHATLEIRAQFVRDVLAKKDVVQKVPIYVQDIEGTLPYNAQSHIAKGSMHFGQRKLFLSELQFFTRIFATRHDEATIVYAGSAPGIHLAYLGDLYPNLHWILVDPNPFILRRDVRTHPKWRVINGLFTDALAHELATQLQGRTVIFISDIRTNVHGGESPYDLDILWNKAMQYNWMMVMKPRYSLLKFRHPFYQEMDLKNYETHYQREPYKSAFELARRNGLDFKANYDKKQLVYLAGEVYLQVWPGQASSEARLFVDYERDKHALQLHEDTETKFFYYNNIQRGYLIHNDPRAFATIKSEGFCLCVDCAKEYQIWRDYCTKYDAGKDHGKDHEKDIRAHILKLTRETHNRHLLHGAHGLLTEPLNEKIVRHILKNQPHHRY
jgi:hypothetical protein